MTRRQQRLTRPKGTGKKQKQKVTGGDPTAPTPEEWDNMTEFGAFVGMFKSCLILVPLFLTFISERRGRYGT
jgi:phage terminase large subunit-like protein